MNNYTNKHVSSFVMGLNSSIQDISSKDKYLNNLHLLSIFIYLNHISIFINIGINHSPS